MRSGGPQKRATSGLYSGAVIGGVRTSETLKAKWTDGEGVLLWQGILFGKENGTFA